MSPQFKKLLKSGARSIQRMYVGMGTKRQCYVCKRSLLHFTKFAGGSRSISEFSRHLNMIGSDVDNFGCVFCDSHDRERHIFMYFDSLGIWDKLSGANILHFAPEKNLAKRIVECKPNQYVRADLFPSDECVQRIDATAIPFGDQSFDLIIANHILEHIPKHRTALQEFHRLLKPGALAILQTPFSKLLRENFEDENINTDELRLFFHGQRDHVRTFGEFRLMKTLQDSGFHLELVKHSDLFDREATYRYGVNGNEDLISARKPGPEVQRASAGYIDVSLGLDSAKS